ncbi:DUF4397 domain-containing protein [Chitinophaga qingshengii]|uniref:DUF4397 domain-containing protein n=1 Tax=Chitinophaga qingshengii TaxID=1569794 RepID=A0ABR7TLZ8_9BACT|nr:DUF4397 domain-containing protein [Chitinophaga qingshengii]MBC9930536.1 DUF4397 domain-containing protein [Chitinophaga qingshengii]
MMNWKILLSAVLTFGVLASCERDKNRPSAQQALLMAVNAAPQAGPVSVVYNERRRVNKLSYGSYSNRYGSAYRSVTTEDTDDLMVETADGKVVIADSLRIEQGKKYSLFIYDTLRGSPSRLNYTLVPDNIPVPAAGNAQVRFLHLSANAAPVIVDLFRETDSVRLTHTAVPYLATQRNLAAMAAFHPVKGGVYQVKIKQYKGDALETLLDIPRIKLTERGTFTLYLQGLTNGQPPYALALGQIRH